MNSKADSIHQIYRTTILYSAAYKIWVDKNFLDKNQRLNNTDLELRELCFCGG